MNTIIEIIPLIYNFQKNFKFMKMHYLPPKTKMEMIEVENPICEASVVDVQSSENDEIDYDIQDMNSEGDIFSSEWE